jgi:hypothetical protein
MHRRNILLCNIIIIIMKVVGLGLSVMSCVAHSLSGDPVFQLLFGRPISLFLHGGDTVVLVVVSSCFPFCLSAKVNFVGSF